MSRRKVGYTICVVMLAIIFSVPQIFFVSIGLISYSVRRSAFLRFPGSGPSNYGHRLEYSPFWQDKFVVVTPDLQATNGIRKYSVSTIDPETGETRKLDLDLAGRGFFYGYAFGTRMYFLCVTMTASGEAFEVINGNLQPATFTIPTGGTMNGQRFLWNNEPAIVQETPRRAKSTGVYGVSAFQGGAWKSIGRVVLPAGDPPLRFGPTAIDFRRALNLQVFDSDDGMHVFANVGGRLLHHKGLSLKSDSDYETPTRDQTNAVGTAKTEAVSETLPMNAAADGEGWTLVRDELPKQQIDLNASPESRAQGVMIDGQPTALIIDDTSSGHPIGRLYQLRNETWKEIAAREFPFGSMNFRTVTTADSQRSYLVVSTSTRAVTTYAIELTGFRQTRGAAEELNPELRYLAMYGAVPVVTLILGIVLAELINLLMWRFTTAEYAFGTSGVRLASLHWRGIARLIDLGAIGVTTVAVGGLMTLSVDWLTLAEALNLRLDHPTIRTATTAALVAALWLLVCATTFVLAQAVWGMTPGKWFCGLKTVRTSLRPCGFARSLAREIVFFFDCGEFLCWTPGILSIALTVHRQRLGDLIADTIVVESKSLTAS